MNATVRLTLPAATGVPLSRGTLIAVAAAHAAVLATLWLAPPEPEPVQPPQPLTLSLITQEPEATPEPPPPPPPAPQPVVQPQPKPLLAARPTPRPEPAPAIEPPPPTPEPVPEVLPAPTPTPVVEAPKPAAPPPPPTPPRPADYLSNPRPPYPRLSVKLGEEGTVKLRVFVNADGTPGKIEMNTGSGFERLDNAALAVMPKWRFIPAQKNGRPVADWVVVPVEFKLNKG